MTIDELLRSAEPRAFAGAPEADPLTTVDALQEADLVDARLVVSGSSLAVLFDLRSAQHFRLANTAVLLLRQVSQVHWMADEATAGRKDTHHVVSSKPEVIGSRFLIDIQCLRGWRLRAIASSAEFLVGHVASLPDDDRARTDGIPGWDSALTVVGTSTIPGV